AGLAGGRVRADGAGLRAHEAVPHAPVHADRADHQGHRAVGATDPQGLRRHGRDGLRRGRRRGVADHGRAGGGRVRCAPRPARMKFGVFYEHQLPRPWENGAELKLFQDALDQVELADRLGIDYAWEVEHHFLEEYSHSTAPEVFLAAASQRTNRIRLGHGIVQLPQGFNHTARVAERIATLDLLSDGRVDFGTGESSSESELGGFGVERDKKRDEWTEALDAVTRMFVEEPVAGYEGRYLTMPQRNVVPKPLPRPHPRVWVPCSARETTHLASTPRPVSLSI